MEDWRRNVCVGGFSPFFIDDDFLVAWEFEFGLFQGFLCMCNSDNFATT
jgi:hypothetical protein